MTVVIREDQRTPEVPFWALSRGAVLKSFLKLGLPRFGQWL